MSEKLQQPMSRRAFGIYLLTTIPLPTEPTYEKARWNIVTFVASVFTGAIVGSWAGEKTGKEHGSEKGALIGGTIGGLVGRKLINDSQ